MNSSRTFVWLWGLTWLGLLGPALASAMPGTWATDAGVGSNELAITIEVDCPANTFICSVVDGYTDSQASSLSGSGVLEVDSDAGTIQFVTDGNSDLGFGPQPTFHTLAGSDVVFAYLPFAGVPEFMSLEVFATAGPAILPVGFASFAPGDYPVSATLPYALLADVVGDLEFNVPDIVVPAQDVTLTGTLRVLGDTDSDGFMEYELRGLSAQLDLVQAANIGGEPVEISVTSVLTSNLSGEVAYVEPEPVPVFGALGVLFLALVMVISSVLTLRLR